MDTAPAPTAGADTHHGNARSQTDLAGARAGGHDGLHLVVRVRRVRVGNGGHARTVADLLGARVDEEVVDDAQVARGRVTGLRHGRVRDVLEVVALDEHAGVAR